MGNQEEYENDSEKCLNKRISFLSSIQHKRLSDPITISSSAEKGRTHRLRQEEAAKLTHRGFFSGTGFLPSHGHDPHHSCWMIEESAGLKTST